MESSASDLYDAALTYRDMGLTVIPVAGKIPRAPWRRKPPPHPAAISDVWQDPRTTGAALPMGDIVARDYDVAGAYDHWRESHTTLAALLPTSRTGGGGFHVFAKVLEPVATTVFADGELRSTGSIVVVPPSLHHSGCRYEWIIPLTADVPRVSLAELLGEPLACACNACACARTREPEHTESHCVNPPLQIALSGDILVVIDRTLPDQPRQRHHRLFGLALALRRRFPTARPGNCLDIVREWHRLALPTIRTQPFIDTWDDFVDGWDRIRDAAGGRGLEVVRSLIEANDFTIGFSKNLDAVARVLRAAARFHDGSFYTDLRTIAKLTGLSHVTCWKWTRQLEALGLVEVIERGTRGFRSGKATTWRWTGPV
jgi:hypothetical protein